VVWDSLLKSGPVPVALPLARAIPNPPVNDDDLEECDDPVPLPEPGLRDRPQANPLANTNRAPVPPDDPLILPEDLELMPPSEILRRDSSQFPPV
jgi:hypothetical protein